MKTSVFFVGRITCRAPVTHLLRSWCWCGWGTWSRTTANGARVHCSATKLSPRAREILPQEEAINQNPKNQIPITNYDLLITEH